MAHVGIQRFAAGHREDDGAQGEEGEPRMGVDETDGVERVEGEQDLRVMRYFKHAEHAEDGEPADHDRAEEHADRAGAASLDEEQAGDDDQRDRDHVAA